MVTEGGSSSPRLQPNYILTYIHRTAAGAGGKGPTMNDKSLRGRKAIRNRKALPLAALLCLAILALDMATPGGTAGVPYIAVVLVALRLPQRRSAYVFATIATGLALLGVCFHSPGSSLGESLLQRFFAIAAIWMTARLVHTLRLKDIGLTEVTGRLRSLVDNSTEGIGIIRKNRFVETNRALLDIFGYDEADRFCGLSLVEHVALPMRAAVIEKIDSNKSREFLASRFFLTGLRADGETCELVADTTHTVVNGERLVQITFRDVTKLKEAEDALGRRDALIEETVRKETADRAKAREEAAVLARARDEAIETMARTRDEAAASVARARNGAATTVARARNEAAAAVARSRTKAENAEQARNAALENTARGLHAPIQGILRFSEFGIARFDGESGPGECFTKIRHCGEILLNHTDDLLDLARFESESMTFDYRPTDLAQLIKKTTEEHKTLTALRAITIDCSETGLKKNIVADPKRIGQVLRNLVGNAVSFSPEGGMIEVSVCHSKDSVLVAVRDRGPGVPEDELNRIFDPFVKQGGSGSRSGGRGLGLSICRKIIEGHGGHIQAGNNPGGGAVFSFELGRKRESRKEEKPRLQPLSCVP
jgi:PAS domain S-box-containing protein